MTELFSHIFASRRVPTRGGSALGGDGSAAERGARAGNGTAVPTAFRGPLRALRSCLRGPTASPLRALRCLLAAPLIVAGSALIAIALPLLLAARWIANCANALLAPTSQRRAAPSVSDLVSVGRLNAGAASQPSEVFDGSPANQPCSLPGANVIPFPHVEQNSGCDAALSPGKSIFFTGPRESSRSGPSSPTAPDGDAA